MRLKASRVTIDGPGARVVARQLHLEKHRLSASQVPQSTTNLLGEETEQVFH